MKNEFKTVDEYIALYPEGTRQKLQTIRAIIKAAAPNAEECISYQIPTYKVKAPLVHFAAYEKHIGFYPTPSGIRAFKEELASYKTSKAAVQFPLDKPIPEDLIRRIVMFRVWENDCKQQMKEAR